MPLIPPIWFGLLFLLSEIALIISRRAKGDVERKDQGSLLWFWIVIPLAIVVGLSISHLLHTTRWQDHLMTTALGELLVLAGMAWRWYSVRFLGRWFTVNVALAADHQLIDRGPYRYLRHPSYTGALLAITGVALCMGSILAMLATLLLIMPVFLHRIRIEEAVLAQAFGERWGAYCQRTWRLIPGIY